MQLPFKISFIQLHYHTVFSYVLSVKKIKQTTWTYKRHGWWLKKGEQQALKQVVYNPLKEELDWNGHLKHYREYN